MKNIILLFPFIVFSQLHHQTVGAGGGSSKSGAIYSVGQSSIIGNTQLQGYSVIQGYVQPNSGTYFVETVKNELEASIYPNPFSENFKIMFNQSYDDVSVMIHNVAGQLIYNKSFTQDTELSSSLPSLSSQTFLITILLNNKLFNAKLIKQ